MFPAETMVSGTSNHSKSEEQGETSSPVSALPTNQQLPTNSTPTNKKTLEPTVRQTEGNKGEGHLNKGEGHLKIKRAKTYYGHVYKCHTKAQYFVKLTYTNQNIFKRTLDE